MNQSPIEASARSMKDSSHHLVLRTTAEKNRLLKDIAYRLHLRAAAILEANKRDLDHAKTIGLSATLTDRLVLDEQGIEHMIRGIKDVIALPDPVGKVIERTKRPNGLRIDRVRVPIGAIGIIYEARPNVTVDAAALCLKAGSSVLLRGGSEAIHTNRALVDVLRESLRHEKLPESCVGFVDSTDRQDVLVMVKQDRFLDVIIPRGSQQLIRFIQENSTVPVIAHGEGNCHVFVDDAADLKKAIEIVLNAKTQRPSVCNAAEKLLVHRKIAAKFLPVVIRRLREAHVEVRGDDTVRSIVPGVLPAEPSDWYREYLDLIISVKVVKDVSEAIEHINRYGSHHSDAIVSKSKKNSERFLAEIDSAAVFANASTRFTDGYEFGLGAEIGISTQKLHARGPMGLAELTSTKFVVRGTGQVRG